MAAPALDTGPETPDLDSALPALLKAAADGLRLSVLRILRRDTFSVQELCRILDCSQPGLSHHLKLMAGAGLVATRREGSTIFYRRAYTPLYPALADLQRAILDSADALAVDEAVWARVEEIHAERGKRSRAFFEQHAGEFQRQQEQMAGYELYGPGSAELLANNQSGGELAVEVGPGEGQFLAELSPRYTRVLALDNAQSMLDKARQFAATRGLDNVRFELGDTRAADIAPGSADCVVVNMVLHHVATPADIFSDAAEWLRGGGVLSVTDLCPHNQSWAREACGDLWLGLDPDALDEWALEAGLEVGPAVFLTQKNGFTVQIRQFIKPR